MDEFNRGLKAHDIIKIIKACAENGVKEFRAHDLEFTLGPRDNETSQVQPLGLVHGNALDNIVLTDNKDQDEITPEMEAEIHEQRLEELLIADPLAHEELTQKVLDGEEIA